MQYTWGMRNQIYPTDLTDRHWDCIKALVPAAKAGGRPRTLDMRQVINASLYIVVTGAQWRMLPRDDPNWQSVYTYFRTWRDAGTWQRIHDTLRAMVRRRAGRHKLSRPRIEVPKIADEGIPQLKCSLAWSSPPSVAVGDPERPQLAAFHVSGNSRREY